MADSEFSTAELHTSLVKWLENCLALGGTLMFDEDTLSDGNTIADCLCQLAPEFFTPSWRSKIIAETAGNWKLRHNNLRKIHRSMLDYYHQVLHVSLETFSQPDLEQIAQSSDEANMSKLLQLALGISINCGHKDSYIQAIMAMQQDVQHVVMGAIQNLMKYQSPSMVTGEDYKELEEEHKQAMEQLHSLKTEKDQLLQHNHELQSQLKGAQEELNDSTSETELLKGKLKEAQTSAGISGEVKAVQIQRQLDSVKTERLKVETERDELKHKVEELEHQVQELFQKNRDLQVENEEIPVLRDSLEETKYLENKVIRYESVISQYKKKLEDAQDMRKQVKAMEDKNMMYMQQNLDLEEELRRLSELRDKVDGQKQRIQDLESLLAKEKLHSLEASKDGEDKTQQIEALKSELSTVKRDRDRLSMQVPGTPVSSELHSFSFGPLNRKPVDTPDLGGGMDEFGLNEAYTPELREKMARLEKENEILKRRVDSGVAESVSESPLGAGDSGLHQRLEEQMMTIERLEREANERKQRMNQVEAAAKEYRNQVENLEETKKNKEMEIEKYKKYLNKAKKIIESFGESKTPAEDSIEIVTLKSQLKEREKHVERLEKEFNQDRQVWEREEKLVVSAWYEMGLMMHRKYTQDRLLTQHGSSFLAQQRQALYKRPIPLNTSIANTGSPASVFGDTSQHS